MHQASRSAAANPYMMVFAWMSTALLLLSPSTSVAQTTQGGASLADMARQLRAQKEGGQTQSNSNHAQQIADELSEDPSDNGAPGGFRTFNAGDYRLWVPAPYKVESHDDAGVVVSGPMSGWQRPMVLVGNPIAIHWQNNDDAFQDTATHFSHLYARTVTCRKATVANHSAYKCGLAAGNLLGTEVGGNAMFVLSSGTVYPVFCVTPTAHNNRDALNDPHLSDGARQSLQEEDAEVRKIWQQCDTVLESFHLVRESPAQQSEQAVKPVKPAAPSQAAPAEIAKPVLNAGEQSARAAQAVSDSGQQTGHAPAGFKVHPFQYCKGAQCWNASVLVPADAQLINSTCKQYVFEAKIKGNSFLLLVGPEAGDCDGHGGGGPDPVRWKELVDPETKRAPGTYNLISSQGAKLDGKPAVITTIGFRKSLDSWMGKRAEVENNGVPLVVGCLAPTDHFSDGDEVCSALIDSLQMP